MGPVQAQHLPTVLDWGQDDMDRVNTAPEVALDGKESHSRERFMGTEITPRGEKGRQNLTSNRLLRKRQRYKAVCNSLPIIHINHPKQSLNYLQLLNYSRKTLLQLSKWFLSSLSSAPSPLLPLSRPARLSWSQFLLTLLLEPLVDALALQVVLLEVSLLLSPIPNVRSMRLMRSRLDLSAVLKGSLMVPSTIGSSATINSLAPTSTSKARALAVSGFISPQCSKAPFQANKYIQPLLSAVCPRLV